MHCTYETPYGEIRVDGRRVDGEARFEVKVPDGVERGTVPLFHM